jgi:hypothetical protein
MKTQVSISNGSGWNSYQALRELKALPAGTRGLMQENGVAEITVMPRSSDKPYGIAARYFDADGEEMYCQGFDQNDSASYIRARVTALLTEGIAHRIAANTARIAAEDLARAQAAGFPDAASHRQHVADEKRAAAEAKEALRIATINDPERAARAERDLAALLPVIAAHPAPEGFEWRLDRSGWLGCFDSVGRHAPDHPKTGSIDRDDMRAWLHQHGYAPGVDNRHAFFHAVANS